MRNNLWGILAVAAATVAAGVATNQVISEGRVDFTWAYLALGFTLLIALLATQTPRDGGGRTLFPRRAYRRRLFWAMRRMERHGFQRSAPLLLDTRDTFVEIDLFVSTAHRAAGDSGVLGWGRQNPHREGTPLSRFAEPGRVWVVVGGPGSGKTTMIRHFALTLTQRTWRIWRRRELPVVVFLREHTARLLAANPPTLPELAMAAGWLQGFRPSTWLSWQLDNSRCIVIFDGLDEVGATDQRARITKWVDQQIERYPHQTFVTSRPHGYPADLLPRAEVLLGPLPRSVAVRDAGCGHA